MANDNYTECTFCGIQLEHSQELFKRGTIGEPACDECYKENEGEEDD